MYAGAQEDLDQLQRIQAADIQLRQNRLHEAAARYGLIADGLVARAQALTSADELKHRLAEVAHAPAVEAREAWRDKPNQIRLASDAITQFQLNADDDLYQSNPAVRKACDEIAGLSRFALVEQALLRPDGIVAKARKEGSVVIFGLASDITPIHLDQGGHDSSSLGVLPDGDGSDLTAGIARAVSGKSVRAVVLFTDGRQIGGDRTIVSGLTPNGVPVFTVSAAASEPPHDVSFMSVEAPSSVFAGKLIAIEGPASRHDGFDVRDRGAFTASIGDEAGSRSTRYRSAMDNPLNGHFHFS